MKITTGADDARLPLRGGAPPIQFDQAAMLHANREQIPF